MKKILILVLALTLTGCAFAQTPISQLPQTKGFGQGDAIVNYVKTENGLIAYQEAISNIFGIGLETNKIAVSGLATNYGNGFYYFSSEGSGYDNWTNLAGCILQRDVNEVDGSFIWEIINTNFLQEFDTTIPSLFAGWDCVGNDLGTNLPIVQFAQISDFSSTGNGANWTLTNLPAASIAFNPYICEYINGNTLIPVSQGTYSILPNAESAWKENPQNAFEYEIEKLPLFKEAGFTNFNISGFCYGTNSVNFNFNFFLSGSTNSSLGAAGRVDYSVNNITFSSVASNFVPFSCSISIPYSILTNLQTSHIGIYNVSLSNFVWFSSMVLTNY